MSYVRTVISYPSTVNDTSTKFLIPDPVGSAIGSGNGVVVYGYLQPTAGTPTVNNITITDNASGNTYTTVDVIQPVAVNPYIFHGYGLNIKNNPTQLIVTLSGGLTADTNNTNLLFDEFTDLTSGVGIDKHHLDHVVTSSGTDATVGTSVITTGLGLVHAFGIVIAGTATTLTNGTGFTMAQNDTLAFIFSEYILSHAAGSIASKWTASGAGTDDGLGIMTFMSLSTPPVANTTVAFDNIF